MFAQGFANRVTSSGQEGVGDAAAHDDGVTNFFKRVEHVQFGRDLGATNDGNHRFGRVVQGFAQGFKLGRQQRAGAGLWGESRHAVGGGLGAVRRAEGVHDVDIAQGRVLLREVFVVFLFALVEANVLEQDNFAIGDFNAVQIVLDQANFLAQHLGQVVGDRLHGGGFVVNAFLRAAQMGHQHDFGARVFSRLDGGQ